MNDIINKLKAGENVRAELSALRSLIKDPAVKEQAAAALAGEEALLNGFLQSEDAKTRKNAALLIGDLQLTGCVDALMDAYEMESTRFVRSSYPEALLSMDLPQLLPKLKEILDQLKKTELTDENRKHVEEEIRTLQKNIIKYEGVIRHKFSPAGKELQVLLITNRNLREYICRRITAGDASVHPLGVMVKTSEFTAISKLRTYRELLFPAVDGKMLSAQPREAAGQLWEGGIHRQLENLHTEGGTFYYRLEVRSSADLQKRSTFAREFTSELDRLSGGLLVNSPSDYEAEIRLIASKDGRYFPAVRLYTYRDTRFAYRKNTIASTMNPSTAALIVQLAQQWLKEDAQILDPFCGVGTLLIERNHLKEAREIYAIDIFGDAVELGRRNADAAKTRINFIHRDFFDFRHDYLFDEIITDMPLRGKKTKEEMDEFYGRFFRKIPEHLENEAKIILYTNESGFVKKQLRLHREFRILQETSMQKATPEKAGFDLFILEYEKY